MNIEWIKCSDRMPPDDDREIIIKHISVGGEVILTPANEIYYDINPKKLSNWEWTEFTQEKWEFLNK